jgi:tRNA A37 threonylcarbamoyltransferase TsaD
LLVHYTFSLSNVGYTSIHPLIAVRAHQLGMPHAIRQALADAHLTMGDIDGVAFTRGPGAFSTFHPATTSEPLSLSLTLTFALPMRDADLGMLCACVR